MRFCVPQDGKCHDGDDLKRTLLTLNGYVNVTGETDLRKAVTFVGPISVGIFAALPSLSFYHEGIFNDPDCSELTTIFGRSDSPRWLDRCIIRYAGTS